MGPTGPGSGAGAVGTYANDTWLLTYLLGQPPAVVFGDPVRTSDTIYIPWTFPTQRKVPWGTNIKLPIIDTCTISLIVEGQPEYIIHNNVTTAQLINGQTTVLAIAKPPAATGFSSNGTYNSFYMYSGAGVDQITNSSVNKLKVVFSNTSEFSPASNPSIIQFSGFGVTGATGPSGASGTTGPSGASGTTGPSGTSGTSGPSGTSGTTGPSGTSGTSGTTGPSGTSGTSGTTGPSGTSGTSGASGTTGPSGTSGTSGASGTTGPSGASGTSGTTGPSGTSGTSGTTGPSGTSGTSGASGTTGGTAPAEPPALTTISLDTSTSAANSSTIYRVLGPIGIGSVPLINAAQVATLPFNAPIHRQANRSAAGATTLMTLSATLNGAAGPSVNYSGFPATKPVSATSNGITITPNTVTDFYIGQTGKTGYYLTSADTITVVPSAGSSVNTLTASQAFSNPTGTGASASTTFYYDTPVTSSPTSSINALTISAPTKVSGLSILYQTDANITINASANNMGKYFYRSPLITYNYTYGAGSGTLSETTLANVSASDISNGNMFTNGNLNFSSSVAFTGITNTGYSTTPITINATANNIFGPSTITNGSFGIIMDPLSRTLVYQTQSTNVPTLTPTTTTAALTLATGAIPVAGARIWSAPITTTPSAPAGTLCPDFSYNGIFYSTMPYDNNGSLTSTDPSGCQQDLLISNGLFSTPTTPNAYIDYSTYAGNAGLNYSTISATVGTHRFATYCWKMPTMNSGQYTNLSFYIDSVYELTRNTTTSIKLSNGNPLQVFYAFQNVDNPAHAANGWNSVWIRANATGTPSATTATYHTYSTLANRYGINQGSITAAGDQTALLAAGTAPFYKVFTPTFAITSGMNVYLYLRIGLPMDKDMRFGKVCATLTRAS